MKVFEINGVIFIQTGLFKKRLWVYEDLSFDFKVGLPVNFAPEITEVKLDDKA